MLSQEFHDHHAGLKTQIEAALREAVFRADCPDSLRQAMEYSLLAGGKRLRPALVLVSCEVCGGDRALALSAACAVEMIHTYSLIHDDLPSMDDDDLRRGRPTSHKVFGEALAILAGDALLTLAFETLTAADLPPGVTLDCLKILSKAAGATGMVGGQVLDLEAERGPLAGSLERKNQHSVVNDCVKSPLNAVIPDVQASETSNLTSEATSFRVEHLTHLHKMKTGALIVAALEMGAAVAGATSEQRQRLTTFGQSVGLAFQIADDLLDVTGTNDRLGKEAGRDNELGKLTYPSLIGVEESQHRASELVREAIESLSIFDHSAEPLRQLARFIVERDH